MNFDFKTVSEFNDYFKDEKTCYGFLEAQRWNGIPVCPHCASAKAPYKVKTRGKFIDIPSYRCSERVCDLPFTVRTGSIFEGSKVELRKWFQAAYEISISKKGISSVELASRIGVSQKTAWFINHRLRTMLTEAAPELLSGMVEIDETYVGGKNKNRHWDKKHKYAQGAQDKTMVIGFIQRGGKIVTKVMPNTQLQTMRDAINENVDKTAAVITDAHNSYKTLKEEYANHTIVKVKEGSYVTDKHFHTNNIEGYWSHLKRGIIGTFHFVSPQHLQRYCNEFAYRHNRRTATTQERFLDAVRNAHGNRLKYRELTPNQPKKKATK